MYVNVNISLRRLPCSSLRGQLPSPGGGRQYFYGHNGLHSVMEYHHPKITETQTQRDRSGLGYTGN